MALDSKVPQGPLKDKWTEYKNKINLVNPANKRHIDVIVVGTGLAGGSGSLSCVTSDKLFAIEPLIFIGDKLFATEPLGFARIGGEP